MLVVRCIDVKPSSLEGRPCNVLIATIDKEPPAEITTLGQLARVKDVDNSPRVASPSESPPEFPREPVVISATSNETVKMVVPQYKVIEIPGGSLSFFFIVFDPNADVTVFKNKEIVVREEEQRGGERKCQGPFRLWQRQRPDRDPV